MPITRKTGIKQHRRFAMAELNIEEKRKLLKPILDEIKTEKDRVRADEQYAEELIIASESDKIKEPQWYPYRDCLLYTSPSPRDRS